MHLIPKDAREPTFSVLIQYDIFNCTGTTVLVQDTGVTGVGQANNIDNMK